MNIVINILTGNPQDTPTSGTFTGLTIKAIANTGINLQFVDNDGNPQELAGGTTLQFSIKQQGNYDTTTFLTTISSFTWDSGNQWYSGILNTNTNEIIAAIGNLSQILCIGEVEWQGSSDNQPYRSLILGIILQNAVAWGDEGPPTPGTPTKTILFDVVLPSGINTGIVDYSSMELANSPSVIGFLDVGANESTDDWIWARVIQGTVGASTAAFQLTAVTDNAERVLKFFVQP